jgi:hypothetical protein
MLRVTSALLLLAAISYASQIESEWAEDAWVEHDQGMTDEVADLLQVGWGNSKPKTKTVSMDVDASAAGGLASAAVCVEASIPTWVPTSMMNQGMKAMWATKIGKNLNAALSANADLSAAEFEIDEKACERSEGTKDLVDFSKKIPFIGNIGFHVYAEHEIAGFSALEDKLANHEEVEDLLQSGWGKPKASTKQLSMDMDAKVAGGLMSGSICFQASVPSWVPTQMLAKGLKAVVESKILKKLTEANPKLQIAPDEDTALVEEKPCNTAENPDSLLDYTLPSIPFVGNLAVSVKGSGIKTDLSAMMGR